METNNSILTINGGSSSIKFTLFEQETLKIIFDGKIDHIGMDDTYISFTETISGVTNKKTITQTEVMDTLVSFINEHITQGSLLGIGYRVAHGGFKYNEPTLVTEEVLLSLEEISTFAPQHLPIEIELIRTLQSYFPAISHVACFDTSFYKDLPKVAQILSIPKKYIKQGIRRYGFHGLSYDYITHYLSEVLNEPISEKKIILMHLGGGSSVTALKNGHPVDTSMGFTPNSGVPMGTRSGDLDSGLFSYFTKVLGMTSDEFNEMVTLNSGVKGISGLTPDMEVLLKKVNEDEDVALAVDYYCQSIRKTIGAYAAVMDGVDILVFTGGMGERAPEIRRRICNDFDFLGIKIDEDANNRGEETISSVISDVKIYTVPTNESHTIARGVREILL